MNATQEKQAQTLLAEIEKLTKKTKDGWVPAVWIIRPAMPNNKLVKLANELVAEHRLDTKRETRRRFFKLRHARG